MQSDTTPVFLIAIPQHRPSWRQLKSDSGSLGQGYSLPLGMHFRIAIKLLYFLGQAEARGSMNGDIPLRKGFGAPGHIAHG
jgi:hypothetical protein